MKNLRKYILIACSLFTLAACDLEIDITNPGLITEEKPDRPQAGETITYRAQVWVEKNDMEELYGGERLFRQNLEALFRNTTTFGMKVRTSLIIALNGRWVKEMIIWLFTI